MPALQTGAHQRRRRCTDFAARVSRSARQRTNASILPPHLSTDRSAVHFLLLWHLLSVSSSSAQFFRSTSYPLNRPRDR